jgi:predicted GIY-YIG superfamily endonuclease
MDSLRDQVRTAFLAVHEGQSTDDVVIDPDRNARFLEHCADLNPAMTSYDANWTLLNLRKSSSLGGITNRTQRLDHSDYVHASQIAARLMEDRFQLTVDRVLCDPESRRQFDEIAANIAPDVSVYRLRKAALGLRKARRLQPELIKRIADWGRQILDFTAEGLVQDLDQVPRQPGIYIFRDSTGYLYVGEGGNLRLRVAKHLDHSDRKALAHYFWDYGISGIVVEIHAFRSDSDARKQAARRAYESDLIDKRLPRFNIRL